jgi:hypothetical protein
MFGYKECSKRIYENYEYEFEESNSRFKINVGYKSDFKKKIKDIRDVVNADRRYTLSYDYKYAFSITYSNKNDNGLSEYDIIRVLNAGYYKILCSQYTTTYGQLDFAIL